MAENKGEITYEIRADDSKVEKDIEQANKKVEKAAEKSSEDIVKVEKNKTEKLKEESKKTVKNAEHAADDVADAWKDAGKDAQKAMSNIEAKDVQIKAKMDVSDAESAIQKISRDQSVQLKTDAETSKAEKAIKGLKKTAEETGKEITNSFSTAFGNIGDLAKDSFSDAASSTVPFIGNIGKLTSGLSGASVAALGIGTAFVGAGSLAVNTANDMQVAMNGFLSETGKSREELDRYQGILEGIYANNYGESFEDIAGAMASVTQQMGDLNDSDLQKVTEGVFTLTDVFETDFNETLRGVDQLMVQFGLTAEEALDLMAAGSQEGLNYTEELGDNIAEYGGKFAQAGYSADEYFQLLKNGTEGGAYNLDKVNDAINEVTNKLADGSIEEKLDCFSGNTKKLFEEWQEGGMSQKDVIDSIVNDIRECTNEQEALTMAATAFGTMGEDANLDFVKSLSVVGEEFDVTKGRMESIQKIKYDDLGSMFEALKRNVELLLLPLGESLMPILLELIQAALPAITELLVPLLDLLVQLLPPILALISQAIGPLAEAFIELATFAIQPLIELLNIDFMSTVQSAFEVMSSVAGKKIEQVQSFLKNLLGIFSNLIDFVKNVFTGNWRGAWENVKNIFKHEMGLLEGIFKAPINAIVSGWNSLSSKLGSVKVPDWVPGAGGKSFSLPKLPKLRVGMDYVPSDDFPALLHRGEAVLTAEENRHLMELGGLSGLEGKIATVERIVQMESESGSSSCTGADKRPIRIEVPVNLDGREAARAIAWYMGEQLSWEEM